MTPPVATDRVCATPDADAVETILDVYDAAVARAGCRPAIVYLDAVISYSELDRMSDALAALLIERGFVPGDRLALFLQNSPHFVIGMIAAWKAGGVCVPINPMNLSREVCLIFADSTPTAILAMDELFDSVIVDVDTALMPTIQIRISAREFQTGNDGRIFAGSAVPSPEVTRFDALLERPGIARPLLRRPRPEDLAMIVYTSGTTGLPKGALISHGAFGFNAAAFRTGGNLQDGDAVLGIAPLFHITGSVACLGLALNLAAPLILTFRFEPGVVLDMIARWQPRFMIAAVTAFIAIYNHPDATRERLASLGKLFSGGAPVPLAFVQQFETKFGHYIHNCYGLTETTSATHITPFGERAPVSEQGVLSVGKTAPGVSAHVIAEDGNHLPTGEIGELVIRGPMVAKGYWQNPVETSAAMRADGFMTGDMAFRDDDGWYYLVDRKKDVIISSGYKVWPREVEDVLYGHPAVREAAVVGVPHPYRGETVKAFVSLKPGSIVAAEQLISYCKARMAAYKYPRLVDILPDLPKTPTGKILRRALRR
ncbi:MAG: AMP-dependent synthetase and ligase [Sphingomonadales bacterium]|nr:AMP-dependent synthetase and ligase [Sphingomonadales bacterium]